MTILLAYWKPILAALLAFLLVFGVLAYGGRRYSVGYHTGEAVVIAADAKLLAQERARNTAQGAIWAAQQKDEEYAYQSEIDRLRLADIKPGRIVRLCISPISGGTMPGTPTDAAKPADSTPNGGVLPPVAGADIGGRLYADADKADALSAQVRGLLAGCK